MKKHLILVLALAFVAALTVGAYAEVQNVKVSGDLTVLGLDRQLSLTSQKAETTMASILRVRIDADLTDNVIATVRLLNERYWGDATTVTGSSDNNTNIDLDLAYVTLKEFLYSPLTLTVGRQEIHFGNDMIVGAAMTNNYASGASTFGNTIDKDLSVRKSFDAVRATLNYDPLVIDFVAAQISKDWHRQSTALGVPPTTYTSSYALNVDDQDTLVGVNANYTLNKTTTVEAYFWQRRMTENDKANPVLPPVTTNKKDITNVPGMRIVTKPMDILTLQAEGAYQFGTQVDYNATSISTVNRRAFAIETAATLDLKNIKAISKYKPSVTALYAYFSGDKGATPGTHTTKAWDPMYENQKFGDIANAIFNQSDAQVLGGNVTMKPTDDITLKGEYYAFWLAKEVGTGNYIMNVATQEPLAMTNNKFLGQEMDFSAVYSYTEDVQFGLLWGIFDAGNAFAKQNRNTASEVIGSMKVTF